MLWVGNPFLDGLQDDPLGEGAAYERLVVARALRGGEAAVVAAALPLTWAIVPPQQPQAMLPASRWAGNCFCRLPCSPEEPRFPLPPSQIHSTGGCGQSA